MGTQLLVESPVLLSQMSAVKFSVTPLKLVVPLFTNWATPANCSGVEMSKAVWDASYQETSDVPFQIVCACNDVPKPIKRANTTNARM